ncbi:MAG TPA: YcxB family protein [Pyrinomonadaceae bacterium]
MRGTVELSFSLTEEEYVSAARSFYARSPHAMFNFYTGAAVLAGAMLFAALAGDLYLGGLLFAIGFVGVAWRFYTLYTLPRAQFRRNPKLGATFHLTFSEEGIFSRTKGGETRLEWGYYSEVRETPDGYFLLYGKDMFSLLPKRVFVGPRQEATFRELLRRKLGLGAGAPQPLESGSRADEYVPPVEPPDWR